jgi:hypothetical protein
MASRTVRLDEEAESALREIRGATGMTASQALKNGLLALRSRVRGERRSVAWDVYERIDRGPGGYASTPARDAKRGAREAIRRKHKK